MVYGRDPKIRLDFAFEQIRGPVSPQVEPVKTLVNRFVLSRELARQNIQIAQQKQKAQYDRSQHVHQFKVGDKVLILVPITRKGESTKLHKFWEGPLQIHENHGVTMTLGPSDGTAPYF